jgi:hypothetical protein
MNEFAIEAIINILNTIDTRTISDRDWQEILIIASKITNLSVCEILERMVNRKGNGDGMAPTQHEPSCDLNYTIEKEYEKAEEFYHMPYEYDEGVTEPDEFDPEDDPEYQAFLDQYCDYEAEKLSNAEGPYGCEPSDEQFYS